MNQNQFPFERQPDTLLLSLPAGTTSVQFCQVETPYGFEEDMLCYRNETLLGQSFTDSRWPATIFVTLLPKLNPNRQYSWPTRSQFSQALLSLLIHVPHPCSLRCERDTDQHPIRNIGIEELPTAIVRIIDYCANENNFCPDFAFHRYGGLN
jgi:hypothetical protein